MRFLNTSEDRTIRATHVTPHPDGMRGEQKAAAFTMDPALLMVAAEGKDPKNPAVVDAARKRLLDANWARGNKPSVLGM